MKPPLTLTLDREKLNHPVHVKEEKSNKERRDKKMRKLRKNEGFTLAELLIVVAIIAVLVAVSIPIFTSQLEKSREATDVANMRAAKAAAVTMYLNADKSQTNVTWNENDYGFKAYYNTDEGVLTKAKPGKVQGKGTSVDAGNKEMGYDGSKDHSATNKDGAYVTVVVDKDGNTTIGWADELA